jgi:glycosyltransferase involved in cell wall biosynthesis
VYLIPIGVPIFRDGDRLFVATDWQRALRLLRDSLGGRYGDLVVAAPWLPTDHPHAKEQRLGPVASDDGIRLEPLFDARTRARSFWVVEFRRMLALFRLWLEEAKIVHTGLDELYRPTMEVAFLMAVKRGVPTVFVQDTDIVVQSVQLAALNKTGLHTAGGYAWLFESICRASVARADLTLLKGKALMERYGRYARNAHEFQNTSYVSTEVQAPSVIEARLRTLTDPRPLRFVYSGRLVVRKGVAESIRILHLARQRGARATLDIIGGGPEEPALRELVLQSGLEDVVRFRGSLPYGTELIQELSGFDALLFTPLAEDTPRMIFDGYAGGLPLVASAIQYVKERANEERATVLLPWNGIEKAAERIVALDKNRQDLVALSHAALEAGQYHAADAWYRRRADWTHEAMGRRNAAARTSTSVP